MNKKVLITGSTGFIGSHILENFIELGYEVVGVSRSEKNHLTVTKNISDITDWSDVLDGVEIIIHCAAAVHKMNSSKQVLEDYEKLNVQGTLNLANQAKGSVKRFIFLSTVKVHGEESFSNKFFADDILNPADPYSESKLKAENGLKKIAESSKMELVIIRPPLVYGPNPKGNLKKLSHYIRKNIPLPFKCVNANSRSMVYIRNLVDFIYICSEHKAAANQTFLISDDEDLSLVETINLISEALNKKSFLIPMPLFVLKLCLRLIGKDNYAIRLTGNLSVDITKNKKILGWKPKYKVKEAFQDSFKS